MGAVFAEDEVSRVRDSEGALESLGNICIAACNHQSWRPSHVYAVPVEGVGDKGRGYSGPTVAPRYQPRLDSGGEHRSSSWYPLQVSHVCVMHRGIS